MALYSFPFPSHFLSFCTPGSLFIFFAGGHFPYPRFLHHLLSFSFPLLLHAGFILYLFHRRAFFVSQVSSPPLSFSFPLLLHAVFVLYSFGRRVFFVSQVSSPPLSFSFLLLLHAGFTLYLFRRRVFPVSQVYSPSSFLLISSPSARWIYSLSFLPAGIFRVSGILAFTFPSHFPSFCTPNSLFILFAGGHFCIPGFFAIFFPSHFPFFCTLGSLFIFFTGGYFS